MTLLNQLLCRVSAPLPSVAVMYHSTCQDCVTPSWLWSVSASRFREQIRSLLELGYQLVTQSQFTTLKERATGYAVVTFDDGYQDNWPCFDWLAEQHLKATWFIVSQRVGQSAVWDGADGAGRPLLTHEQVREIHAAGMEIGGHGRTHCKLAECADEEAYAEIAGCKSDLEAMLGAPIQCFAYPYGSYDDRAAATTEQAGYQSACVTKAGFLRDSDSRFTLRRIGVYAHDDLDTFVGKILQGRNEVDWRKTLSTLIERTLQRTTFFSKGI